MTISASPVYNPTQFNFTHDVVGYWGKREHGDPVALVWNPPGNKRPRNAQSFHFSHFSRRARKIALGLRRLGIEKGHVLFLMSSKTPEWYEVFCGCILAGVVVCPCSPTLPPSEITNRIVKARGLAFVGNAKQTKWLSEIQQEDSSTGVRCIVQFGGETDCSRPDIHSYQSLLEYGDLEDSQQAQFDTQSSDPCLLYFTSGTTGQAKIVQHTHVSYPYAHTVTGAHWLDFYPGKLLWNTSEQGWAKATWAFFGAWTQGGSLFLDADEGPFDPERVIQILGQYPITTFCAAPTVYRQLSTRGMDEILQAHPPRALEHCLCAGESLSAQVILKWSELTDGLMIWDGYGQSETVTLCGNYPSIPQKLGSMGKPLPGVPLHILNRQRQIVPPYEEGDIAVKIPAGQGFLGLFAGYIQDDGSVIRPVVEDQDGQEWYLTGDRAHYDDEGYFWFKGRGDDVIISSGHRIGPAEVESVLHSHPAIVESAVVASPDKQRGSVIKAFIVLRRDWRPYLSEAQLRQEIQKHCLQYKPAYCCPQKMEFVADGFLPKTVSGKVIRKQLRMLDMGSEKKQWGHLGLYQSHSVII